MELTKFFENYIDYQPLSEFCNTNSFLTYDDFVENESSFALELAVSHPSIKFTKFRKDLEDYHLSLNNNQISNLEVVNLGCQKCLSLEIEMNQLKKKVEDIENWIKFELKKFDNQKIFTQSGNDGDILLKGKWICRMEILKECTEKSPPNDIKDLIFNVFGENYLKKFESVSSFSPELKVAFNELLDSKLLKYGGKNKKELRSFYNERIRRFFHNRKHYEKNKNKKY
ncbi:hypothetical protein BLOT_011145, partial [Blomia tropicalis]